MNRLPAVLYVEDDRQSRKLMQMLLSDRMRLTNVTILPNSEDFLEHVQLLNPKPDIIFLDIHMEPLNGFEMLEILRQQDWAQQVPIIALTASVMNEEVQRLKTSGFNGCLAKPLDLAMFPDVFRRILNGESIWRILAMQRG
ncbi:MAG: response regulator [Chloroflexi bacterium]|nr:response regulator [Chloroflexota bacterium]